MPQSRPNGRRTRTITLSIPTFAVPSPFALACLGASVLVLLAYANSLHNTFHFDDTYYVVQNPFIRNIRNIPRFFTDARTFSSYPPNATYRPLVTLTFAVDYWLGGGLNPLAFHLTQLTCLIAIGALLVALYVKLFATADNGPAHKWVALFAATLFCVHTGNTQSVNYIAARSELLSALGLLGSFAIYLYAPRSRRQHWYLLPMVVGAFAKTPAVMFGPLLLVYKLLIEEQVSLRDLFTRATRSRVLAALRSSGLALGVSVALFLFIEGMNAPGQSYGGAGRLQYLTTQTWMWARYVRLFVIPTGLTADSDLVLFNSWQDPRVALGLIVAAALLIGLWRTSQSKALRPVAFGVAWFWIGLIPASSIFPLAEVTNDHRVFLPFMGLAAAAGWWVWISARDRVPRSDYSRRVPAIAAGLAMLVLLAHAAGTYQRNRVWRDDETLWADVVAKGPSNGRGLMNYGISQMEHGRYQRAKELFIRAQALVPNYPILEVNLGVVDDALGDPTSPERHFTRAIALDSTYGGAHFYYGNWLVQHRRADEAIPHLQRAIALNPTDVDAAELLMNIYAALGAGTELKTVARRTMHVVATGTNASAFASDTFPFPVTQPSFQNLYNLGVRFTQQRRHLEAAQAYRAALSFDRNSADAWNNLGWSLAELGFDEAAIVAYENAVRLRPEFALARNNLAAAKLHLGDALFRRAYALQLGGHLDEAIALYRQLLAQSPDWAIARYNVAHALMTQGKCAEAVPDFERALALQPSLGAVHLHLANCYDKLGQRADAAREKGLYASAQQTPRAF